MKLLSLNVEGIAHIPRVMPLIHAERPDIICLQEAGTPYQALLEAEGYTVGFMPRCIRTYDGKDFTDGLLFASLLPHEVSPYNFYTPHEGVMREQFDAGTIRMNNPGQILLGSVASNGKTYHIATTHFTWAPDGNTPSSAQQSDMQSFLDIVVTLPAHIMCGDFNLPRNINWLYTNLLEHYTDEIPATITTSLDPEFHKIKDIPDQVYKLEKYVVDYIFSQPGYLVSDVRQKFGVSDHSAMVCEIAKGE